MNQPNAVAIVIGIETYRGAELPRADHAERDARTFAEYLRRTLGLNERNIRLLVGAEASKSDIVASLEEWLPSVLTPGANVYFYFSGHGAPDPNSGETYLVPFDGDPAFLRSKGIAVKDLYASLGGAPGKPKVLAFLDSCFSGGGARSVLPKGLRPLVPVRNALPNKGALAVFAAATGNQAAGPSSSAPHGLFTEQVLKGLSGAADRDGDGSVSVHELHVFVKRNVEQEARRANRQQTPVMTLTGGGKPGNWVVVEGFVE